MPYREKRKNLVWLMPPSLDEWVAEDHVARFVVDVIETVWDEGWEQATRTESQEMGAPAYHPSVLVGVWLYGFMTAVRSTRKLETACRDQIPLLWLTGNQQPDHNTLWRFYERHQQQLRGLFKKTVRVAVRSGCVDLALQAVDGTKVAGNAAKEQTFDEAGLQRLLEKADAAIADLEAQNRTHGEPSPPRLPGQLARAETRRASIAAALQEMRAEGRRRVNLTDRDAQLMKTRRGFIAGFNAQAVVARVEVGEGEPGALLVTAADVVCDREDHSQLLPMLEQAAENLGEDVALTLADGGYHSGPNLSGCEAREQVVVMPEAHSTGVLDDPYHKDRFAYDAGTDRYTCPEGQVLTLNHTKHRRGHAKVRVYRGEAAACRGCPAFGRCTRDWRQGRSLEIGPHDEALRRHRAWMATEEARAAYVHRKELPEPVFGIAKEQLGLRRFLRRGHEKVRGEWLLLMTAFNLRTIYRVWRRRRLLLRQAHVTANG